MEAQTAAGTYPETRYGCHCCDSERTVPHEEQPQAKGSVITPPSKKDFLRSEGLRGEGGGGTAATASVALIPGQTIASRLSPLGPGGSRWCASLWKLPPATHQALASTKGWHLPCVPSLSHAVRNVFQPRMSTLHSPRCANVFACVSFGKDEG